MNEKQRTLARIAELKKELAKEEKWLAEIERIDNEVETKAYNRKSGKARIKELLNLTGISVELNAKAWYEINLISKLIK